MEQAAPQFLDVPRLIEASVPQPRPVWVWYALMGFALLVLTMTFAASGNPQAQAALQAVGGIAMLGSVVAMGLYTSHTVKQQRQEQQRVEAIEELVQLRRWD